MSTPRPTGIELHTRSRELELRYPDGESYRLPCEYLRVFSPSAEVQGHGPGQEVLQTGKLNVAITDIMPVGNYALGVTWRDQHNSIFAFDALRALCPCPTCSAARKPSKTSIGVPPGFLSDFTMMGGTAPMSTAFDTRPGWARAT